MFGKRSNTPLTFEAASFLASIVESAADAIIGEDLDGTVLTWNRGAQQLFGYDAQEVIGHSVRMLFPIDRKNDDKLLLDRIKRGERVEHFETLRLRKDGSRVEVSLTVSPIRDSSGQIVGASKIIRDITAQKQAFISSLRLAAIVESSNDAIISKTLEGIITTWNKAAENLFGYTAEDAIGQPVSILFPQDRLQEETIILERIKRGERVEHFETMRLRKDGSAVAVSLTISPIRDAAGKVVGASKIVRDITEQKKAAKTISQLRLIIEAAPNGMVMVDNTGKIRMVNAQMERLFGYDRSEMLGQRIEMLLPERYRDKHPGQRASFFAAPQARAMGHGRDLFARRKDGSEFPVEVGLNPAETPDGMFVLAAVIDITARKKAEDAANKSAAQLRLVIDAAPNGMVMVDDRGRMTMVNAQMERLFGYDRSEMLGQRIEMLLPERYRSAHPAQRGEYFRAPEARAMGHGRDLYGRHKNGSEFPVEVGLNPADTPDGRFVLAAVIDITARKKAEDEVAKSAGQLRLVIEAAPNGMVMVNEDGVMTMVNAQMERLFGYDRSEMLGQKIEMLLPERYRTAHPGQRKSFFHSPEARAMGHGRDLFGRRKDGSEFPVEVGLNPADTPEGKFVLAAVIDITQRKRMEEELGQAHARLKDHARNLEELVAERTAHLKQTIAELEGVSYSLSHDMRAPLRTIRSFSQIVLEEAAEKLNPMHVELLNKVINSSGRLDRLIQDVLTYSRVTRERVQISNVDVERLIRQIIDERSELQPPNALIRIEGPIEPVRGHEAYLTQCITNLLDNAVKFVVPGKQPEIRIWNEVLPDKVRLWIEDKGIGIPSDFQSRMFGIFERVHDDKTYPGTGIGLAIVRKAVERMGGAVGVESRPGEGSRFWLELLRAEKL